MRVTLRRIALLWFGTRARPKYFYFESGTVVATRTVALAGDTSQRMLDRPSRIGMDVHTMHLGRRAPCRSQGYDTCIGLCRAAW